MALLSGCGSSDDSGDAGSGTSQAGPSGQASGSGLTQRQYDQLEPLLVATLPLDDVDATTDPKRTRRLLDDAAAACSKVDREDPLLAAMVDECESTIESLATTDADCDSMAECAEVMRGLADTLDDLVDTVRENEPTIVRAIPDRHCQEVLLSPREIAILERGIPIYRRMADAIASGDQDAFVALQEEADALDARSKRLPSARRKLADFRRHCGPEAA